MVVLPHNADFRWLKADLIHLGIPLCVSFVNLNMAIGLEL